MQAAYESDLHLLGIYNDNKMVGLILYDFDFELNGWSMSRFMIDEKYQNHGIGKAALQKFKEFFINRYGHLKLYTSAEVENHVAIALYEELGFEKRKVFEYEYGGKNYREIRMLVQL